MVICDWIGFRNEVIRDQVKVTSIEDKKKDIKLIWFDHVKRRCVDAPMNKREILTFRNTKEIAERLGRTGAG